jgi:hypothetical protein
MIGKPQCAFGKCGRLLLRSWLLEGLPRLLRSSGWIRLSVSNRVFGFTGIPGGPETGGPYGWPTIQPEFENALTIGNPIFVLDVLQSFPIEG